MGDEGFEAGFEVLKVVLMKIQVFWDVMSCRLVNTYQHCEASLCLTAGPSSPIRHHPSRTWRWRNYRPAKRRQNFSNRHGVIFRKTWMCYIRDTRVMILIMRLAKWYKCLFSKFRKNDCLYIIVMSVLRSFIFTIHVLNKQRHCCKISNANTSVQEGTENSVKFA